MKWMENRKEGITRFFGEKANWVQKTLGFADTKADRDSIENYKTKELITLEEKEKYSAQSWPSMIISRFGSLIPILFLYSGLQEQHRNFYKAQRKATGNEDFKLENINKTREVNSFTDAETYFGNKAHSWWKRKTGKDSEIVKGIGADASTDLILSTIFSLIYERFVIRGYNSLFGKNDEVNKMKEHSRKVGRKVINAHLEKTAKEEAVNDNTADPKISKREHEGAVSAEPEKQLVNA